MHDATKLEREEDCVRSSPRGSSRTRPWKLYRKIVLRLGSSSSSAAWKARFSLGKESKRERERQKPGARFDAPRPRCARDRAVKIIKCQEEQRFPSPRPRYPRNLCKLSQSASPRAILSSPLLALFPLFLRFPLSREGELPSFLSVLRFIFPLSPA